MAGAKALVARGLVDPERLIIRGSSAGGLTTLCALTFHRTFKAGASYYGVSDLQGLAGDEIDVSTLKAVGLVPQLAKSVKVILSGAIERKVTLKGVNATKGAKAAIEAAGGSVA